MAKCVRRSWHPKSLWREREGLGPPSSHTGARGQQPQAEGRRRSPSAPSRLSFPPPPHPCKFVDPCCHHACGSTAAAAATAAPAAAPPAWSAAAAASTGARDVSCSNFNSLSSSYPYSSATTASDPAAASAAGLLLSCHPCARDCPRGSFCTMAGAAGPCCSAGDAVKSERLRMQLSSVGERFIGFKTSIADDTRRRRLIEEQRFQEVKEGIVRLEKALNGEIKRRVEANRTLQRVAEQMANEMLERLQTRIAKQIEKLTVSLDLLITRCEGLEKNLAQMKGEVPDKLAQETASLTTELMALKEQFELERKGRADREQTLVKRLNELHYGLDAKLEAEIALRQEQLNHLKREADRLTRGDDSHEQFRAFIIEELQSLKSGLALATQAREQSDDEIIHAINQYTTALQKGLRNITSR